MPTPSLLHSPTSREYTGRTIRQDNPYSQFYVPILEYVYSANEGFKGNCFLQLTSKGLLEDVRHQLEEE
ncbi:hypothetical protein SCP_0801380 [Sparassis crispa]|uniref:Uncharacterized protein n=1 Tax=Sparassis crispa TaxID=139825 RepID=A0A401GTW1_9APHY|nr:hypothetical protein SCP_0801380 [Sparassis crispa]GBE85619.1 hypothetical protein SCP_0801380 [Sparassis crispa]